jgi:nitrous oxidase accessory protein NosD
VKKFAILMSMMMLVALTSGVALAKTKAAKLHAMTGIVAKVDAQAGTLALKVKKKEHTLKAEPKMLEGITVGEKVTVKRTGDVIKSIKVHKATKTMKKHEKKMETPKKAEAPKTMEKPAAK